MSYPVVIKRHKLWLFFEKLTCFGIVSALINLLNNSENKAKIRVVFGLLNVAKQIIK